MHPNSQNNTDGLSRRQRCDENSSQRPSFADRHATTASSAAVVGEQFSPEAESDSHSYYSAHDCFSDEISVRSSLSGYETATDEKADDPYEWWEQPREVSSVGEKDSPTVFDETRWQNAEAGYGHYRHPAKQSPCIKPNDRDEDIPIDEQAMEDASGQISPGIEFIMNRTRQRTISQSVETPNCQSVPSTSFRRRRPNSWNCEHHAPALSPTVTTTNRHDDSTAGIENFILDDTRQDFKLGQAPTEYSPRGEVRPASTQSQRFSLPVDMTKARERVLPGMEGRWLPFVGKRTEGNEAYATVGAERHTNDRGDLADPLEGDLLVERYESKSPVRQSSIASSNEDEGTAGLQWNEGRSQLPTDLSVEKKTISLHRGNELKHVDQEKYLGPPRLGMSPAKAKYQKSHQGEKRKGGDVKHGSGDTEKTVGSDFSDARATREDRSGMVKKMIQMFSCNDCNKSPNSHLPKHSTEGRKSVIDGEPPKISSGLATPDLPKYSTNIRKSFARRESSKVGLEPVTTDLPRHPMETIKNFTNGETLEQNSAPVTADSPKDSTEARNGVSKRDTPKVSSEPVAANPPTYLTEEEKIATNGKTPKTCPGSVTSVDLTLPIVNKTTWGQQLMQNGHTPPKRKIRVTARITLHGNYDGSQSPIITEKASDSPAHETSMASVPKSVQNVGSLKNIFRTSVDATCHCSAGSGDVRKAGVTVNTAKVIPIIRDMSVTQSSLSAFRQNVGGHSTSDVQHRPSGELIANTARICVVQSTDGDAKSKWASRLTVPMATKAASNSIVPRTHADDRLQKQSKRETRVSLPSTDADSVAWPKHSSATSEEKRAKNASTLSVNGLKEDKVQLPSDRQVTEQYPTNSLQPNSDAHSGRNIWYTKFTQTHIRWAYHQSSRAVMVDNAMTCRFAGYQNLSSNGNRSIVSTCAAFLQKEMNTQQGHETANTSCFSTGTNHNVPPGCSRRRQWEPRNDAAGLADRRHRAMAVHTVLPPRRQSLIISTPSSV